MTPGTRSRGAELRTTPLHGLAFYCLAVGFCLLLSSCLGHGASLLKSDALSPPLKGSWRLEVPAPLPKGAPGPPTAVFLPELKRVQGSDGCNAYEVGYEEPLAHELKFGLVMSTRKLCSWQRSGGGFTGVFSVVTHYRIEPGPVLVLMDAQDRELARFRPIEPAR